MGAATAGGIPTRLFGACAQLLQQLGLRTLGAILCDLRCVTNAGEKGQKQATESYGPHGGTA